MNFLLPVSKCNVLSRVKVKHYSLNQPPFSVEKGGFMYINMGLRGIFNQGVPSGKCGFTTLRRFKN